MVRPINHPGTISHKIYESRKQNLAKNLWNFVAKFVLIRLIATTWWTNPSIKTTVNSGGNGYWQLVFGQMDHWLSQTNSWVPLKMLKIGWNAYHGPDLGVFTSDTSKGAWANTPHLIKPIRLHTRFSPPWLSLGWSIKLGSEKPFKACMGFIYFLGD